MQSLQESQVRRRRLKTSKKKHTNHLSSACDAINPTKETELQNEHERRSKRWPKRLQENRFDSPPPSFLAWEDPMQPILEKFGRVNWKLLQAIELATRAQTLPPGLNRRRLIVEKSFAAEEAPEDVMSRVYSVLTLKLRQTSS